VDAADVRRLRWRCRRGLLEVDLLLQRFARDRLEALSAEEAAVLAGLLERPDAELLEWLLGRERPEDPQVADVVDRIRRAGAA
jgi:antitoxin CptB